MTNELRDALSDLVEDLQPPVGLGQRALTTSKRMRRRRGLTAAAVAGAVTLVIAGGVALRPADHVTVRPAAPPVTKVKAVKIGEKVPIGDPSKPGGAYAWIAQDGGKLVFHFQVTGCPKDEPNRLDKSGAVSQTDIADRFASPLTCVAPGAQTVPIGLVTDRPAPGWAYSGRTKAALTATRIGDLWLLSAQLKRSACMTPQISLPELQSDAMGYTGEHAGCSNVIETTVPFEYGEKQDLGAGAKAWATKSGDKVTINATIAGRQRVLSSDALANVKSAEGKVAFCAAGGKTVYVATVVPFHGPKVGVTYGGPIQSLGFVGLGDHTMATGALPSSVPCAATGMPPLNVVIIDASGETPVNVPIQVL
ncbi:hypothetical protein [Fodinicola acaciae]|uniref:hypothetical protein n=1 Tax=Fodinicola acaciae TaxID=2681555 RepID=UPI0013D0CC4B|nr:hypothetical protein [Fodinicola acaciae]